MSLWLDPSSELARVKAKLMDKRICAHYADHHSSDFYFVYLLLAIFLCSSTWILQVSALGTYHVCLQTYVSKYAYTYASDHELAFEHKEPRKKSYNVVTRDIDHWHVQLILPNQVPTDKKKVQINYWHNACILYASKSNRCDQAASTITSLHCKPKSTLITGFYSNYSSAIISCSFISRNRFPGVPSHTHMHAKPTISTAA